MKIVLFFFLIYPIFANLFPPLNEIIIFNDVMKQELVFSMFEKFICTVLFNYV